MTPDIVFPIEINNELTAALPLIDESIINNQNMLLRPRPEDKNKVVSIQPDDNLQQLSEFDSVTHKSTEFTYSTKQALSTKIETDPFIKQKIHALVNNAIYKDLTKTIATNIKRDENIFEKSVSSWSFLLSQKDSKSQNLGHVSISQEIIYLKDVISQQTGETLGFDSLTLAIPPSHFGYLMAKNEVGVSALELLKANLGEINICLIPELNNDNRTFALLIAKSYIYGNAGYFTWDHYKGHEYREFAPNTTEAYLTSQGRTNKGESFRVDIPNYRLVITNPEQIAVLTGIQPVYSTVNLWS